MKAHNHLIKKEDFTGAVLYLLKETFEGSGAEGSAYLDRGVGVFNTIAKLSAADASRSVGTGGATIASHLEHARFYLVALVEFIHGRTEKIHWNDSWQVKNVSETDWELLRDDTRQDYLGVIETLQEIEDWNEDKISEAIAIVAHTAYHLGAIRQIMKSFKTDSRKK